MTIPVQADNPPAIAPAGRVHCSLDDLARFAMFHLQPATNGLLKPETLARLHTPPAARRADYACGWVVLQRDWAGGTTLMAQWLEHDVVYRDVARAGKRLLRSLRPRTSPVPMRSKAVMRRPPP